MSKSSGETGVKKSLINYTTNMLTNITDELNIKHVYIKDMMNGDTYDFAYDTITGEAKGFTSDEEAIKASACLFSGNIMDDMQFVRDVVSKGLSLRSEAGVKVRQPLNSITVSSRFNVEAGNGAED